MDLTKPSPENVAYMIDQIKSRLRMATGAAMTPAHIDGSLYEDLRDIYDLVMSKERFSISEIEAIVSELGKLRKEGN